MLSVGREQKKVLTEKDFCTCDPRTGEKSFLAGYGTVRKAGHPLPETLGKRVHQAGVHLSLRGLGS